MQTFAQLRLLDEARHGDFIKRIFDLYSEHAPKACDDLTASAKAGDIAQCGRLAHALKSMSHNVGALQVARIAAHLEEKAKSSHHPPDQGELDTLVNTLTRTLAALADQMKAKHVAGSAVDAIPAGPAATDVADDFERDLHASIDRGELYVEYQPFVDRTGLRVLGVEALVRWRRGGTKLVEPSKFVPVAERTGFINELGEWVLRQACADAIAWPDLTLAVNVSPNQFRAPGLAERIERILVQSGIDARRVELEITETALLDAEVVVLQTIEQLARCGVKLALDDFCTGYSSLTCLRRFPFSKIKIDRGFVQHLDLIVDATIVHAIVSIGRALGLKVVAEGVETAEQRDFLVAAGVHVMQGFLFARPMGPQSVAGFVAGLEAPERVRRLRM
jgi:EAL domain-containing protein (putative c-di-GMP-specific phosphodiesterase class I)